VFVSYGAKGVSGLRVRPSDIVFDTQGRAGVVTGNNKDTGELIVQRDGPVFEAARRRGVVNGLSQQERHDLNQVMDEVGGIPDPGKKAEALQERIDKLKQDPRQHVVTRYLEGQLVHIMMTEGVHPKEYRIQEGEAR
jgi:hypothetical protein